MIKRNRDFNLICVTDKKDKIIEYFEYKHKSIPNVGDIIFDDKRIFEVTGRAFINKFNVIYIYVKENER